MLLWSNFTILYINRLINDIEGQKIYPIEEKEPCFIPSMK